MHVAAASRRRSNSASQSPSSHSQEHQQEAPKQQNQTFLSLASSKKAEVESFASPDQSLTAVEEPSSNSSHGASQGRSRRILEFSASAFGVQRLKRLALNNQRLLRKYGITSVQIKDICNGEAAQRFDLPKKPCPSSPPSTQRAKHKPAPKATQFTPIPQNLLRGTSASALQASAPSVANRAIKLAASSVQSKSQSSLSMEQRTAIPQQISRLPPQQLAPQQMEQNSSVSTESPLLMNLLSSNNSNQAQMNAGNGMPGHPQQMNAAMMRYPPQQQQMQSPMYAAQQSPQYMQGRMPPGNMQAGHPMMGQPMGPNGGMPGQHLQQPMNPQAMPPPPAQPAEQPAAKKRKRQTKKQKEEETKKQQQQQASNQMHPGMIPQAGMPQQMHPDFYMMQQDGQQRVPPMHMANSQMPQYRQMPPYGQYPGHYGQPSTSMMGGAQYQGQQHYPQQMWNPNMPQQHHMAQQSSEYHMQMQRNQMQQPGMNANMQHYAAPQQSPVPDGIKRTLPPSYNDSMQNQFVQQQRQNPSFMSPPPGQPHSNQGPQPNYNMQQPGQMHQSQAAQHYAQQLQHQRVMNDISDNVDDIMATIGGDGAEDFDLDSIELEPMREGGEMPGMQQQPQNVPAPQQVPAYPMNAMHPNAMPPQMYGNMYGSPNSQQFAQPQQGPPQNFQMHPNMIPAHPQMQQQREQQISAQKNMNREQQQKNEQKQLEHAMNKSPDDPQSPTSIEVPLKQQQQVASAIDSVMERVMSGRGLDDSGASTSSQSTPPPNKRKKQSAAKNAQQQASGNAARAQAQMPVQAVPSQQPPGQFPPQMQQMYGNGQHPGTPTQFSNSQQQQFYYQQRMRQQQMAAYPQQMAAYPGQQPPGPSTPLSAPPVSTPDQQYFYNQSQGIPSNGPNGGAPLTPSRSNSFNKSVMSRNESNPDTPQTPNQQPTPQQMSQKMFQENGGSSATSSAAATPSSSSQHRTSVSLDEQSQPALPQQAFQQRDEQFVGGQQNFNQQQYAQYNGHANQFVFNQPHQQSAENDSNNETKNSVVSLKSQAGELGAPTNDNCNTPPSANAGISSATPNTANQLNHHAADTEPKQEPVELAPVQIKHELNNSCEKLNEGLHSPTEPRVFGAEITPKSELNGPTSAAPATTTSTVAE